MIGRTNTGGGGGGLSPNSAVIRVTAPVGSTISFSKGGVVAKVLGPEKSHVNANDNTLADWYYSVSPSNYGTWTVTATLGTRTASDTVIISTNKQYSVEIDFYYLFSADGDYTGEWSAKAWWSEPNNRVTPSLTINTNLIFGITNGTSSAKVGTVLNSSPLPLSKGTIRYTWNSCSLSGTSVIRPVVLRPFADSYTVVTQGNLITPDAETDSLDISALSSGNYYFGFKLYTAYGSASVSLSEVNVI